ncbi:MAG: hypothetical protein CM15mP85_30040 [Rhodobacterales bacterium]|nr:MAG: hypothetical protein CM15mP85_30040 [Rhodobacterales bacterium]
MRDPNLVLNDVLDGLIDRDTAKKTYGVVIKNNRLDNNATEAARKWENEMVNGLERKLADFTNDLNFDDIPETAITASKMRILDSVGVAIAALRRNHVK